MTISDSLALADVPLKRIKVDSVHGCYCENRKIERILKEEVKT